MYSYVQVTINLYDKDGNLIGSTLANVNNLEPGKTWKFKAIVIEDDTDSYEAVKIRVDKYCNMLVFSVPMRDS